MIRLIAYISKIFSLFSVSDLSENIPSVTYRLVRYFGIKITHDSVREFIKSDPDFPSLKSICNLFDNYGIINYALRIDEKDLIEIDRPFLAHINDKGWKMILVYSLNRGRVLFADSMAGKKIMEVKEFIKLWDGVIVITESGSKTDQTDFSMKRADEVISKELVYFALILIFITILSGLLFNRPDLNEKFRLLSISIIFTHILGLVFSILLFRNELKIKSSFTEKLCHITSNTDCEAVTNSRVSKIIGSITWAEIGIVYFSGGLIILSVINRIEAISLIKVLSICSIPYPVFSVLYQWLKIKKWCPLCLLVQSVLMFEFLFLLSTPFAGVNISLFVLASLIFSTIFIMTMLNKYLIINKSERDDYRIKFLKLKREPELFLQELKKSTRIVLPKTDLLLTYGDLRSDIEITAFLSPYCSACSSKFFEINDLIRKGSQFKIRLILPNMKDEVTSRLLKQICFYVETGSKGESLILLEKWYRTDKNLKHTIFNYLEMTEDCHGFNEMVSQNQELFRIGNIQRVPTILVNDFILPQMYTLDELKYHVNEIRELVKFEMLINT
ncbi:MAG TPA: vitamin K epoxide reductase family protein [Candidatus Cloacimonadota bacterium]|nr:vitamin K epoxide reductase family protein [Candidatus Cloacimonadota bacterium]